MSCYPSESTFFVRCVPQYTLRFETVELTNSWYHLFSENTTEQTQSAVEVEPEPVQSTTKSESESNNHTNEIPSRQCPVTVEYLHQKLQEREERLRKTQPPCSIPPIPPPPPKRDHSTLKRRVELKNY